MFKAYFEELANIGETETVVQVAASVGLDGGELRAALAAGRYRAAVDDGIAWSRAIGVTAIPTFVFDERYGVVGAQEYETFRLMMEKLGRTPRS
jgi:predicted DsbA family dithiol-disulfide isomerase